MASQRAGRSVPGRHFGQGSPRQTWMVASVGAQGPRISEARQRLDNNDDVVVTYALSRAGKVPVQMKIMPDVTTPKGTFVRRSTHGIDRRHFIGGFSAAGMMAAIMSRGTRAAMEGGAGVITPAPYRWRNVVMGGGGAIPGIVLHPKVPDLAYIHTDVGGAYRWDATGQNWIPLLDSIAFTESNLYGVDSIAVDPNDVAGNTVYISTGKYTADWARPPGMVMKSTDRGATWTRTTMSPTGGSNGDQGCGERLAVDPHNSNHVVYAAALHGLFSSWDAAVTWSHVRTAPRGDSPAAPNPKKRGKGLAFALFDPSSERIGQPARSSVMYVGATGDGIYQSKDGGVSWKRLDGGPLWPRKGVIASDGVLVVSYRRGVAKFAGGVWTDITPPKPGGGGACAVAIEPADSNHIVATLGGGNRTPVFRSIDGGKSWCNVSGIRHQTVGWWADWQWFSNPFSLAFDPHHQHQVWATDWYGVYRTPDIRDAKPVWTNYVCGIEELCIIGALLAPASGRCRLFSGAADEGGADQRSLTTPPRRSLWVKGLPAGLDRTGVAVKPDDPQFVVCVGTTNWNSPGSGGYSLDGGNSWTVFPRLPYKNIMGGRVAITGKGRRILWVPQIGMPHYSDDLGSSWRKVKCGQNLAGVAHGNNIFTYDQPLAVDAADPNRVYLLHGRQLLVSTDAGTRFAVASHSLPDSWNHKVFSSGQTGDVWVSVGKKGLHRSRNGGADFAAIKGVQEASMFCFGKAPPGADFPALFVQGKIMGRYGYFRSDDQGRTWVRIDMPTQRIGDAPNTMVGDWRVFGGVFVGTNGRGIFYGRPETGDDIDSSGM
ncbi:MAG: WD40/YVTN/BNR-like repeat-containing protein [Phycisphaerae bacterium]